jgi:uncharacterized phage protein (TIGR02220 family)
MSVRTVLKNLKLTSEITLTATTKFTMISITKWDDYQLTNDATNKQLTSDQQALNKRLTTNKKLRIKEDKNSGAEAASILQMFNQICSRSFKDTESNLKLIKARLSEGYTFEDFEAVTRKKFKDWVNDQKMKRYIRPKTFFNGDNFDGYLQEAKAAIKPEIDPLTAFAHQHLGDSLFQNSEEVGK